MTTGTDAENLAFVQADDTAYSEQLVSLESQIEQAREAICLTEVRYRQALLNQISVEYQQIQVASVFFVHDKSVWGEE